MSKNTLILILSLVSSLALALSLCGTKPQFIVKVSPSGDLLPSQTVTFRVGLDQVVSGNQVVNLSTTTPSSFSSFPSTVTVTNGNSTATFQATLTSTPGGSIDVEASCNGESVDVEYPVVQLGK
jgi:hypothetical protein